MTSTNISGGNTLGKALNCGDESFVDFIEGCLRWDPKSRMTPDTALLHQFMEQTSEGV
jgi:dual specificity tyrosine-phosphorylation-regulated kinase 2/3/4